VIVVGQGADAREANGALTRAGIAWEPPSNDDDRTAALALGTLTPSELAGLRRVLADLETKLETRANPLVEDLDDGDPATALSLLLRKLLPAITACDAVASRRRASPDGALVAAVAMRCDPIADAGVACAPLWTASAADRATERARFLEWPLAAAAVLGLPTGDGALRVIGDLRARSRDRHSRIALVLGERDLAGGIDPAVAEVRALAARDLTLARRDASVDTRVLELIARDPPQGPRRIPWLRLDAEEVLVVPKLGALADLDAFAREVEDELREVPAEWVHRPAPIR
jgi:hypothetical protein